ncbi:ABC transporter ATP-binding protein [Lactobacillus helveticus]|nr:ABC transporter ATP-binding protein [Lactobacillus helveticus]
MVNTILKEADLFCPNSVRIKFAIYLIKLAEFYLSHSNRIQEQKRKPIRQ